MSVELKAALRWKPYPAYKPSGVEWLGDIPAHWDVKQLKCLAARQCGAIKTGPFGSQLLSYEMTAGEFKVYNQRNVIDRDASTGENYVSQAKYEELRPFATAPGDLLLTTRGTIGRCYILPEDAEPGILHPCLMRIRPEPTLLLSEFLALLIQDSSLVQTQIFLLSNATTIEVIYSDTMKRVVIPVPPLSEQQQLVAFLKSETTKLDALIAKRERLIELSQEKRAALISHAVTKGLDPSVPMKDSRTELYPSVPQHWRILRLRYLCRKVADGPHFSPAYLDDGIMFLSARNVKVDGWSLDDAKYISMDDYEEFCKRIIPEVGDILYTKGGTTGVARVVDLTVPFHVWVHIAVLKLRREKVNPYFLAYVLNGVACYGQSQIYTRGATNNDLGLTRLINIVLAIPTLDEQARIVAYLNHETAKLDALIARVREGIEKLREYRTALVSAAVTGKIDVREATLSEPPAS